MNFAGGCGWLGGEVAPPHFTTLPHTLNGHSSLKSKLHPLFGCGRVSHNALSTGSCFGHCYGNIMSSLEVSTRYGVPRNACMFTCGHVHVLLDVQTPCNSG